MAPSGPLTTDEVDDRPVSIGVILKWVGGIVTIVGVTVVAVLSWSGVTSTINTNHLTVTAQFNTLTAQISDLQTADGMRKVEVEALRKQIELMTTSIAIDHFDQAGLNRAVSEVKTSVQTISDTTIKQSGKIDTLVEAINELRAEIRRR